MPSDAATLPHVGSQFKLRCDLTAIAHNGETAAVTKLPTGKVVTVAAIIPHSAFVQVMADTGLHEVLLEDLIDSSGQANK